jgi:hypothetical protein
MSFLQTAGIAAQAGDKFDDERQQRRLNSQREQANQMALDENMLYREIVKMAYQHEMSKEQAAALAKRAAPAAPGARGAAPAMGALPEMQLLGGVTGPQEKAGPFNYKDGGAVKTKPKMPPAVLDHGGKMPVPPEPDHGGKMPVPPNPEDVYGPEIKSKKVEKYNGVYDDTKATDRLPTIFQEFLEDLKTPGYKHGGRVEQTVAELLGHMQHYADGGEVAVDENGVPIEEEERNRLSDELIAGSSTVQPVEAGVPDARPVADPTNFYGRLLNSGVTNYGGLLGTNLLPPGVNGADLNTPGGNSGSVGDSGSVAPAATDAGIGISGVASSAPVGAQIGGLVGSVTGIPGGSVIGGAIGHSVTATEAANVINTSQETEDADMGAAMAAQTNADAVAAANAANADSAAAAAAGEGGATGTGPGVGAGDAWADGGQVTLWSHAKKCMGRTCGPQPKAKPQAVKFKGGGRVRGPGGPTSDSVKATIDGKHPARLSNKEYVLPVDSVTAIGGGNYEAGVAKLDALRKQTHKPVARR